MFTLMRKQKTTALPIKIATFFSITATIFFSLVLMYLLYKKYITTSTKTVSRDIDFNAYLTGALIVKNQAKGLYDIELQNKYQEQIYNKSFENTLTFRNTPLVALLYLPYTYTNVLTSYTINYLIEI